MANKIDDQAEERSIRWMKKLLTGLGTVFVIVGVIVGTYSSLFIATPVMYDSVKKDNKDVLKKKSKQTEEEAATA